MLDQGDSVGVWVDVWERDEGRELDTVDNNILLLTFSQKDGESFFLPTSLLECSLLVVGIEGNFKGLW